MSEPKFQNPPSGLEPAPGRGVGEPEDTLGSPSQASLAGPTATQMPESHPQAPAAGSDAVTDFQRAYAEASDDDEQPTLMLAGKTTAAAIAFAVPHMAAVRRGEGEEAQYGLIHLDHIEAAAEAGWEPLEPRTADVVRLDQEFASIAPEGDDGAE